MNNHITIYFTLTLFILSSVLITSCKKDEPSPDNDQVVISGFTPDTGRPGTEVTITGENFSETISENTVTFNDKLASIHSATSTELKAIVPDGATSGRISVIAKEKTAISENNFQIIDEPADTWLNTDVAAYTGIPTTGIGFNFVIDGKAYVGAAGQDNENNNVVDFWEYDPESNTWAQKADFPGLARNYAAGFVIGSAGYMGTGYNGNYSDEDTLQDFWKYDPLLDEWSQVSDFPGIARSGAAGFSIGEKGYIALGIGNNGDYVNDIWEYDPGTDDWSQKEDLPGQAMAFTLSFTINDEAYIGVGQTETGNSNEFWMYDPIDDNWTEKASYPENAPNPHNGFTSDHFGYAVSGELWQYDAQQNKWIQKSDPPANLKSATSFYISPYAYVGLGKISGQEGKSSAFFAYLPE